MDILLALNSGMISCLLRLRYNNLFLYLTDMHVNNFIFIPISFSQNIYANIADNKFAKYRNSFDETPKFIFYFLNNQAKKSFSQVECASF